MAREEVLASLQEIFADAFDREDLRIGFDTKASDVEGWDSIMQMKLVKMIEDEFHLQFSMDKVVEMTGVSSMVDSILAGI